MIKQKLMYVAAMLVAGANAVHAQFSLEIDGQEVVPAGQITDIRYNPDLRTFVLDSVHLDWRCVAQSGETPAVSPGDLQLVLDSANPVTETDAIYRIAGEGNGGSITQDISGGKIVIQTTTEPSQRLVCAPFRESFFSGDFENLFTLDDDAPTITASGSTLTVPFAITNRSRSLVATGIEVRFVSDYVPDTNEVDGPTYSPIEGVMSTTDPDTWQIEILYPGDSASIEVAYEVGQSTPDGTRIQTSIDQVTAMNRAGDDALDAGDPTLSTSVPVGTAEIGLLKTGTLNDDDGEPGVTAGDTISYTFEVTNNSQVTLTDIQIADPQAVVSGGPLESLASGATDSETFTATYALTQADVDAGSFTNLATVTSAEGAKAVDGDTRTYSATPAVTLTKIGQLTDEDGTQGLSAGDTIEYTFVVENTGAATLTSIAVSDPGATVIGGPIASLAPGASDSSIIGSYTVMQSDIDAGQYENTASVSSAEGASDNGTHLQTLTGSPAIALTKTGQLNDDDGTPGVSVGDTISYTFEIQNVGNVTLTGVSVSDPGATVAGGPVASIEPGSSDASITGSYTITQADIDAGSYANTALASSAEDASANDTSSVTIPGNRSLSLFVTSQLNDTDQSGDVSEGDRISYSFTLWNTGNVTLTNLNVAASDPNVDIDGGPIATLAPGTTDSSTITGLYEISQADIDNGSYTLFAFASSNEADDAEDEVTLLQ